MAGWNTDTLEIFDPLPLDDVVDLGDHGLNGLDDLLGDVLPDGVAVGGGTLPPPVGVDLLSDTLGDMGGTLPSPAPAAAARGSVSHPGEPYINDVSKFAA